MKKVFLLLSSLTALSLAQAQWGDWGSGGGSGSGSESGSSGSAGAKGSGTKGGGSVSASATTGSGSSESGGTGTSGSAALTVPTIGTHYDDPAEARYETPFTNNDGRPNMEEAVAVPYPYLREADMKFKRRIWRNIDTRQKMNKSFTWPRQPITMVLYDLAVQGKIKAYKNDSFASWYTPEQVYTMGSEEVITQIPNWRNPDDPTDVVDTAYYELFRWEMIKKFQIVEDWIFDYKYGEFRPRIIGISPQMTKQFGGNSIDVPMYWLKMDDIRPTLAKCEVFNRYNDAMRISWDDLFNHYRLFDSYIVKETEYDDLYIAQRPEYVQDGLGALIEGENIKNDLFIFEHDLWEY